MERIYYTTGLGLNEKGVPQTFRTIKGYAINEDKELVRLFTIEAIITSKFEYLQSDEDEINNHMKTFWGGDEEYELIEI